MNPIRFGTIAQLDHNKQCGIILDDNCQDIPFDFKDLLSKVEAEAKVTFEIELNEFGLVAIKVSAV